jgi:hypothetical protein
VRIVVEHWFDFGGADGVYHIDFYSLAAPPHPIPVSETGYRSHFGYRDEVETFPDLLAWALAVAERILQPPPKPARRRKRARRQLSLSQLPISVGPASCCG